MNQRAILLTDVGSSDIGNAAKLLQFFGVESDPTSLEEFLSCLSGFSAGNGSQNAIRAKIVCSADVFDRLIETIDQSTELSRLWGKHVHSAFVYSGVDPQNLQRLAGRLIPGDAVVDDLAPAATEFDVTNRFDAFCGPMAGIRGSASSAGIADCWVLRASSAQMLNIISVSEGAIFLKLTCHGAPVFLSTSRRLVDLDSTLPNGMFDIRDHVSSALAIVLYVKWAFRATCWDSPEVNACLVIDDPLLRPNHGFINFYKLLARMEQHRFSTNIAFIPWNSRRSAPETVKLFKDNPNHYSISVHGCDHDRAEFGTEDPLELPGKARRALERMTEHEFITGLGYDPVMVFPQGVFSKAAPTALQHAGFIAAVNNDTIDVGQDPAEIRIGDFWDIAVRKYGGIPIFTRRYPLEGVENFAFDILLGKPAIGLVHHDYCSDDCKRLTDFIDRLNLLNCSITWRTLGDVIRRSYREKAISTSSRNVEMYASELCLENCSDQPIRYLIRKHETDPSLINEIRTESGRVAWDRDANGVFFEVRVEPGGTTTVSIRFNELPMNGRSSDSLPYKAKIAARRYLCELRDNYFDTCKYRIAGLFRAGNQASEVGSQKSEVRSQKSEIGDRRSEVERTLSDFANWLSRYGETSWDHQSFFAGPFGGRAKALYYRNRLVGTAAVAPMIFAEAFVPSARRLFHRPTRFPIADAQYAMGFAFLYETTGDANHLQRAVHFLDELKKSRCPGFEEYCWGYPFDWVWRGGVLKAQTPLITTTPYCYEAFVQVAELLESQAKTQKAMLGLQRTGNDSQHSALNSRLDDQRVIIDSIARHAAHDIKDFPTSASASGCSYTPFDEGGVINAAAYRAFLLTSASQILSHSDYWRIAERNLNFVIENQNPDGSWFYAVDGVRDFVDHYHTCFVLKALAKIHTLTGNDRCLDALSRGIEYYLNNLFAADGLPKPFSKAPRLTVYKRELYDCAECINACLLLRDRFPQLKPVLEKVVGGILKDWIKPDGSFRSRRLHFGWDNVPMHRWGQSQMFRALAFYLCEQSKAEKLKSEALKTPEERHSTLRVKDQPQLLNLSPSQLS